MDIWVADRSGADWGLPRRVENVNSEGKEGSPTVARDGTLYFFSDRGHEPNRNAIYASRLVDGHYQAPSLLPQSVNVGPSDTSPFIGWCASRNIGPMVNSAVSEYNPAVSRDGRQLYFGRNGRLYVVPVVSIPVLTGAQLR